jgi:hypothetical protein
MRQHQPVLKDPAEASALLDQVREVAGKYNILVENPAIGTGETTRIIRRFSLRSKPKVRGRPGPFSLRRATAEEFVVFENVNLAIDGSDPTMMRGKFKIARWFAPGQKGK